MRKIDKIISKKVYQKCVDKGYTSYSEIALLLGTTDSFIKAVFSSCRRKLNLYHLIKFSYLLKCNINDFLPERQDYQKLYGSYDLKDEYDCFIESLEEEN